MNKIEHLIEQQVKEVISEATKVSFEGHELVLKIDANEDPNKKGIKVQFIPTTFGSISKTEQNDIAIQLADKLDAGLGEYGIRVERDRDLKDKSVIGFFIYIEYFDRIIRKVLKQSSNEG